MTRQEHIEWCKKRALAEIDHSGDPKQGIMSIMSDIRKHPETASETLAMLCMLELQRSHTAQSARNFINGFN